MQSREKEHAGRSLLSAETEKALVHKIVSAISPEKIILFGSAARGQTGPSSDVDLLVIKAGDFHHIEMAQRVYEAVGRRGYALDVVVATPEEIEKYRDEYCLVLHSALREGKVLYDAQAA